MREALHVPKNVTQDYVYNNDKLNQVYKVQQEGSAWIYDILHLNKYRILFMEGDTDGSIYLAGTWKWIKERKFPLIKTWTPWFNQDGEWVGFTK